MTKKKTEELKKANITPFGLRMPPDIKERIVALSERNGRSMNSEIIDLISKGLDWETMARDEILALANSQVHSDNILGELQKLRNEVSETNQLVRLKLDPTIKKNALDESDEMLMRAIADRLGFEVTPK